MPGSDPPVIGGIEPCGEVAAAVLLPDPLSPVRAHGLAPVEAQRHAVEHGHRPVRLPKPVDLQKSMLMPPYLAEPCRQG